MSSLSAAGAPLRLGVLDGGLFAGTRLVELADLVLSAEEDAALAEEAGS